MTAIALSAADAAELMGVTARAISKACKQGRLDHAIVQANGGPQYRIALESLPLEAQCRHWKQQAGQRPREERRELLRQLNLEEAQKRRIARECGVPRKDKRLEQLPWTDDEFARKEAAFFKLPGSMQAEGNHRSRLMVDLANRLREAGERGRTACVKGWAAEQGMAASTAYEWLKRIANLEPAQWRIALVPEYERQGRPEIDVPPEIWSFVVGEWGTTSKPALKPIYRRAKALAAELGLPMPSYATVQRRINDLPRLEKLLRREGEKALEAALPSVRRDYETLALHEQWNADGRMADVHCRWPDGTVGRPVVVAFMEMRSRVILGWAIGRSESAHLVRQAFAASLRRANTVPIELYFDNGRAFASKEITGQQPTRYRFKHKEDDPTGLATMFGCRVKFAAPYNGREKPIESCWNNVAEAEKRREFVGAYCGNAPHNRPDNHDMSRAVSIELYERVLREEFEAYNQRRGHRGDAMGGDSPLQVYERLAPSVVGRQPTQAQLKQCLLAAKQVKLKRDFVIEVLGNRYGCDELLALQSPGPYTALYDPEDGAQPLLLFDGQRHIMDVPPIAKIGFADRDAAQQHKRAQKQLVRAVKEQVRSQREMDKALLWDKPTREATEPDPLPPVGVPQLFKPAKDYSKRNAAGRTPRAPAAIEAIPRDVYMKALARGEDIEAARRAQEHEPRRAAGGM